MEELDLGLVHDGGATPVGPAGLAVLVIIIRSEVYDSMYETKHEALRSPVDNNIDSHVIDIEGYLVSL